MIKIVSLTYHQSLSNKLMDSETDRKTHRQCHLRADSLRLRRSDDHICCDKESIIFLKKQALATSLTIKCC